MVIAPDLASALLYQGHFEPFESSSQVLLRRSGARGGRVGPSEILRTLNIFVRCKIHPIAQKYNRWSSFILMGIPETHGLEIHVTWMEAMDPLLLFH